MIFVCAKEINRNNKVVMQFWTETNSFIEVLTSIRDYFDISAYRRGQDSDPIIVYLCKTPFNYHQKEESFEKYLMNNCRATVAKFECAANMDSFKPDFKLFYLEAVPFVVNVCSKVFSLPTYGDAKNINATDEILEALKVFQFTDLDRLLEGNGAALFPDAYRAEIRFTFYTEQLLLGSLRFKVTDFFNITVPGDRFRAELRGDLRDVVTAEFNYMIKHFFKSQVSEKQTHGSRMNAEMAFDKTKKKIKIRISPLPPLNENLKMNSTLFGRPNTKRKITKKGN